MRPLDSEFYYWYPSQCQHRQIILFRERLRLIFHVSIVRQIILLVNSFLPFLHFPWTIFSSTDRIPPILHQITSAKHNLPQPLTVAQKTPPCTRHYRPSCACRGTISWELRTYDGKDNFQVPPFSTTTLSLIPMATSTGTWMVQKSTGTWSAQNPPSLSSALNRLLHSPKIMPWKILKAG